jgi:hypothetical protein
VRPPQWRRTKSLLLPCMQGNIELNCFQTFSSSGVFCSMGNLLWLLADAGAACVEMRLTQAS